MNTLLKQGGSKKCDESCALFLNFEFGFHADKCRNEDDVRSMDARNKITQDMLQPKVRRSFSDEEGSSEDLLELSDVDSESSDIRYVCVVH